MNYVQPKKHLGQHFLTDKNIAEKIVQSLSLNGYNDVLEIGSGMGILTEILLQNKNINFYAIEIDSESVAYLKKHFSELNKIIEGNFLKVKITDYLKMNFAIIGNFPYNISSQIIFRVLDLRSQVSEVVGMFQKEVAERITAKSGNKIYGILSVLTQAFYDVEYLFSVSEKVFNPPPKVKSAVIRMKKKENNTLNCNETLFFQIVKAGFNQRRKMLKNALKAFNINKEIDLLNKRAEQLEVADFVFLTQNTEN